MAYTGTPWLSNKATRSLLTVVRYFTPVCLFLVFLTVFVARSIIVTRRARHVKKQAKQNGSTRKNPSRLISPSQGNQSDYRYAGVRNGKKALFLVANLLILASYVGNGVLVAVHALLRRKDDYWCGEAYVIYVVGTFFVYLLVVISLIDTSPAPTSLHAITWIVSLLLEIILTVASTILYSSVHREGKALKPDGGRLLHGFSDWETIEIFIDAVRIALLVVVIFFYILSKFVFTHGTGIFNENGIPHERTALLKDRSSGNGYLSDRSSESEDVEAPQTPQAGWLRPDKLRPVTWWEYIANYSLFFKYIWPSNSPHLKTTFSLCVLLLIAGRGVNVLVPYQAGKVTDMLAEGHANNNPQIPWGSISVFIFFRLLQGSSGLITNLRSYLWIPIGQYSHRELAIAIFEHVHTLSLDFHINKKTGEVVSAMNKGGSINTFLDQVTFQVAPMLVDLCIAIAYFFYAFDTYFALVVALSSLVYMYATVRLAQWRASIKRETTNLDRIEDAIKTDSIGLYDTVKYFNAEEYENHRYRDILDQFQDKEYTLNSSLCLMNAVQNLCFTLGLMMACYIAAFQISVGQMQVGSFVALLTYMSQLQQPLNYFGTFYRSIQSSMINAERILELFKESPTVFDKPSARNLVTCEGRLRFRDVKFSYDGRRPALTGLDFECKPGTRTAFVGASGAGKSTVFRLLYRFYEITSGAIEVDGQNVADLTINSVRSHIGVVPQETPLFNETIMWNLKYADQDASDEEVFDACRAASIHDKIMEFPDGYESKVGERGVKLSGGEKQRLAIARTILKNPRILLLDEPTASLDSETEQRIQDSIMKISEGRTTLVIAHRLSTIVNADQIVVVVQGKAVERGTHEELLALDQRYARMWKKHIKVERAELQALALTQKAQKLSKEARTTEGESSGNVSEEEGRVTPQHHQRRGSFSLQMTKLGEVQQSD